jgi:hypothetical protein
MLEIITELPQEFSLKIQLIINSLEEFGITHVGHGIIVNGTIPTATYSHQTWARKYAEEKLYKIDPLRRYALNTPFHLIAWNDMAIESKEELYALEERKKTCSVKRGVLISLKRMRFHETFVFGSDYNKFNFCDIYLKKKEDIDNAMKEISSIHRSFRSHM